MVASLDRTAAQESRRVVQSPLAPVDEAGQDRAAVGRPAREFGQRFDVVVHEPRAQDEVLRRVAGDGEFGEADDVGTSLGRAFRPERHRLDVAVEVADGRVDLADRDPYHNS